MFSNKGYAWKLTAALTVVAGLGIFSAVRGESIHPALWRCLAEPARWDGTELWLSDARVLSSDTRGFEIEYRGARAFVVPAGGVGPGDRVSLTGTFQAAGRVIRLDKLDKSSEAKGPRLLSEIVSVLVLALILLNFLRHFAFRPKVVQAEGLVPGEAAGGGRVEGRD